MKIDELGFYLQANGRVTKVVEIGDNNSREDNCYTDTGEVYYPTGDFFCNRKTGKDIIAYIPPALHFEVLRIIEAYHTTDIFKTIIENCYKNHLEKKGE